MSKPLSFNPFEDFIGKTIKSIDYYKSWIDIEFDDDTRGDIVVGFPNEEDRDQIILSKGLY